MEPELISVIVPVYNVEKYIERCIESIIYQTYKNIEIILVDDGSTDNSGKVCDDSAKKDKRINVIHKKNGGLSDARNVGLDIFKGEYVVFVDSDDYIDKFMIEKLYKNLKENSSDISICNFYRVYDDQKKEEQFLGDKFCIEGIEKFEYLYNEYYIQTVVAWNKMYKRKIFDNIRYPKSKLHEDEFVICDILEKADKISYFMEPLYFYVQRSGSIMKSFNVKKFEVIEAFNKRVDLYSELGDDILIRKNTRKEFIQLEDLLIQFEKDSNKYKKNVDKYYCELKRLARKLLKYRSDKKNMIIKYYIASISSKFYIKVFRKIKKR